MNPESWTAVDTYAAGLFLGADPVLEEALRLSAEAGLPPIQVSSCQGKFLHLLARLVNAGRILEIGTLGGYSTIWLARGLRPGGTLVTLEYEPRHAAVARQNLERAGLAGAAEVRVGAAADSLPLLESEGRGPFDLIFIDADKAGYPGYLRWALRLSRPGTLIVADNVVRGGAVADAASTDPNVLGVRGMNEIAAKEPRLFATVLQTVGSKGYDGFMLAVVGA
jgi:predicted O-methyltransferase YrrM